MAPKIIALVLPLGLDTFAVAAALGAAQHLGGRSGRLRLSMLFMAFESGMPLLGLALGLPLARSVGGAAGYVASAILAAVGLHALLGSDDDERRRLTPLSGAGRGTALLLGLSVSLDELAIGFTLGLLKVPALLVIGLIGAQALVVTQVGLRIRGGLGKGLGEGAERVAGGVLILTAVGLLLLGA
jgi:putative Mn2+ efflux pump MntP